MLEDEARMRIIAALARLRKNRTTPKEEHADDEDSVQYHVDTIIKAGGGKWNRTVARDYIQNLEMQIGQEVDAPLGAPEGRGIL